MNDDVVKTVLEADYIFIPFINENKLNIREDRKVFREDLVYNGETKVYSPVSGIVNNYSEVNSTTGVKQTLIIENDFKDTIEHKHKVVEDIYKLKSDVIKKVWVPKNQEVVLNLEVMGIYDLKNEYLLSDNMSIILKTLDLLDQTYPDIKVSIFLDKRDIRVYQMLFTNLGTYPNINIEFSKNTNECTILSIYDVIDIYNELKKCNKRDYIYLTLVNGSDANVIKTKRYSNLKDLLENLEITASSVVINDKIKLNGINFLLDENVNVISIN